MKNFKLITAAVAVVALGGAVATGAYIYNLNTVADTKNQHAKRSASAKNSEKPFADLEAEYAAMKGEEYDKAFVTDMVAHHQGAVSMAYLALSKAKHQELKIMAQGINDSQMQEIRDMETWKKEWGYSATNNESGLMAGMDHGNGEMEERMAKMTKELSGLSGDEFDKAFLELMIEHHQSAVAMARPGVSGAGREEVKNLALEIVTTQTKEIDQMKKWQKEWGYNA